MGGLVEDHKSFTLSFVQPRDKKIRKFLEERPANANQWPDLWGATSVSVEVRRGGYASEVSISVDELRAIGARVRAEAEAAGELTLTGSPYWDIPQSIRDALLEDVASGAYEQAARAAIAHEPED